MQLVSLDYGMNLDELLASPNVAAEFDQMSAEFAPGFTPFEYRWAALSIRKRATKSKKLAMEEFGTWFDDPLPSGILERDRVGIVSFLFYELLHQTLYVPGRIAFNETLASAVSARMTEQFFRERDDDELVRLHDPPPAARSSCILRTWASTAQRSAGTSG